MNTKDVTTKLAATEASLKRWQTRLKRAATTVNELDRQRRRYQLQLLNPNQPVIATVKVRTDNCTLSHDEKSMIDVDEVQRQVDAAIASTFTPEKIAKAAAIVAASDIPACLDRKNPVVVEQITAARKQREAEERKKMPLTGAAALKKIKSKK